MDFSASVTFPPWLSLGIVGIAFLAVSAIAIHLLRIGYKIRG